jgi:hypothetical protein
MSGFECSIAGVRLFLNRAVTSDGPVACGPASCHVSFGCVGTAWLSVPNPGTGSGVWIRPDGREAAILADPPAESERARELRWAVPFIAALQGETVLHAAAVERDGRIFAFVAESRTGKSAFSATLAGRGWNKLVDDLLPQCAGRPAALFFLHRPPEGRETALRRLPGEEAFDELARNGFGELAAPPLWETHFRYYCELLEAVPCYAFTIPDGMARIEEAAAWWERAIQVEGLL